MMTPSGAPPVEHASSNPSGVRRAPDWIGTLTGASKSGRSERVTRRPCLLLVARDEDVVDLVVRTLDETHEIRVASSVEEVHEEMDHRLPEVIVADLGVLCDDAEPLLWRLADRSSSPGVVLLTHAEAPPHVARLFGVPWMHKPFDPASLGSAVEVAREQGLRAVRRTLAE